MSKFHLSHIAAAATLAAASFGAQAQSFTVLADQNSTVYAEATYPAGVGLLGTGLFFNIGDTLDITATGTWSGDPSLTDPADTSAAGYTGFGLFNGLPNYSLVGLLSASPTLTGLPLDNANNVFLIGNALNTVLASSGYLYLGFLDSDYLNNSGSVTAVVNGLTVTPVPEPGTYALMLAGLGVVGWMARRKKAEGAAQPEGVAA